LSTGKYKGEEVELDIPIETPEEQTKYKVYADNSAGDVVCVRFSGDPAKIQSNDKSTPSYWNNKLSGSAFTDFKHRVFFDASTKRIRSVRDGVQEYLGIELGIEPASKVFTVYRSPETISAIAGMMDSLPIINDHIDPEITPTDKQTIGVLKGTEVVEFNDDATSSTLYLENDAVVSSDVLSLKDSGKKEFSLGYLGKLKEHDKYDFEQYALNPTHLALVDSARGGSVLTFIDKRSKDMKTLTQRFTDAVNAPSMQEIVDFTKDIPEIIKNLPAEKAGEVMSLLQEMITVSGEGEEMPMEEVAVEDIPKEEIPMEDMDKDEDKEEAKFEDSKKFKDALVLATDSAVKEHSAVIEKAIKFVDEQYSFTDKSTQQIMIDALAVEHGETKFEDGELKTAFKLLKKSNSSLSKFGDSKEMSALEARIQSDLGEA
jgi:hypothetical protein